MYLLTQNVPMFDFAGLTPQSPLYIYAPLALLLLALAVFARRRQLRSA
jgi:MYXO-CTERM domain-containing protein